MLLLRLCDTNASYVIEAQKSLQSVKSMERKSGS